MQATHQATHTPGTLSELRARFFALGRAGANADVNHPDRKEWENLRWTLRQDAHKRYIASVGGGQP